VPHDFASDNHAGAHPEVLEAIHAANDSHAPSYGHDSWTEQLQATVRTHFGDSARAWPVFNGTGANVVCLSALARPHDAVISTAEAHINVDECGAPERVAGLKLLTVETERGKLDAADVGRWDSRKADEHHVQPRIVSLTQSTELGTVYRPDEVEAIVTAAHDREMFVHVDGARLANAAASLGVGLGEITSDLGVDVVSFGGTKNGLVFGELAVFLGGADDSLLPFVRKQLMQLASKMRFISAQFEALLGGDLWLRNATHANRMAKLLAERIGGLVGVELIHPVEANGVFVAMPRPAIEDLHDNLPGEHPFYVWDEPRNVIRLMCSWDTSPEDVEELGTLLERAISG
jgi:threonine aldolase